MKYEIIVYQNPVDNFITLKNNNASNDFNLKLLILQLE